MFAACVGALFYLALHVAAAAIGWQATAALLAGMSWTWVVRRVYLAAKGLA
jgi:hypothetical protein